MKRPPPRRFMRLKAHNSRLRWEHRRLNLIIKERDTEISRLKIRVYTADAKAADAFERGMQHLLRCNHLGLATDALVSKLVEDFKPELRNAALMVMKALAKQNSDEHRSPLDFSAKPPDRQSQTTEICGFIRGGQFAIRLNNRF